MIAACAFCGRENESGSRFCMDCGKPLDPPAARAIAQSNGTGASAADPAAPRVAAVLARGMVACPHCTREVDGSLPFCGACGGKLAVGGDTVFLGARKFVQGPRLALLDDQGEVATVFTLERGEAVVGRGDADIRFGDDTFMSPLHARLEMRDGTLWLRDLGSRNMSWVFIQEPARLVDRDMILVGSQVLRFRRLGFPGPHTPDVDATRRMGSFTPSADVALLEQLRADGSTRDTLHLSPGRSITIGREVGDWTFPYDQTMSGRHAEIRSEDTEFLVYDLGSRNGVAVAIRGERPLQPGQRLLLGDQLFRVESL